MPRVAAPAKESLAEFAALFQTLEAGSGFVPNSMLTMGRRPELLRAFADLASVVLRDPGVTSPELRWLVAHIASTAAGCRYCQAHTAHNAAAVGADPAKLAAAWAFETDPRFSEAERAAMRLAAAAAAVPNAATDDDVAAVRELLGDDGVVEVMGVIALFGFLNRWNDTMATELEASPLRFAADHLQDRGWEVGKHAGASA